VATFTEDYDIMGFDRLTLRINAGETYLVRRLEIGDRVDPEVVFLGERGVYGLDLALEGKPLPFTSNCASGMTQSYRARSQTSRSTRTQTRPRSPARWRRAQFGRRQAVATL